jgi:hypothetical protein
MKNPFLRPTLHWLFFVVVFFHNLAINRLLAPCSCVSALLAEAWPTSPACDPSNGWASFYVFLLQFSKNRPVLGQCVEYDGYFASIYSLHFEI